MKYSVPTNWDDSLIKNIVRIKKDTEVEIYGKLHEDCIGGGRPAISVSFVSSKNAERHIRYIHAQGLAFNYLLNTSCLNNMEYTRKGQQQLRIFLEWLSALKVESVTVAIPYLLELIKKQYPHFKVNVSTMAHVNSLLKAKRWVDLGADKITLSNTESNRNFSLFKVLERHITCEIQLVCNVNCLFYCPFHFYHANISSHASQSRHANGGFIVDYCFLSCRLQHLMHPHDFIRSTWIRPEDTIHYEESGIDSLKLIDRGMTTQALIRVFQAYIDRRYEGNLMDLFRTPSKTISFTNNNLWYRFKYFFKPLCINIFKFAKGGILASDFDIFIDNRMLDDFIKHFLEHSCENVSCEECRYCFEVALKIVKINKSEIVDSYKSYKESLVSGDMFRYL